MSNIHTEDGFSFNTRWGRFAIGQTVKFSKEAKENENYDPYLGELLLISWVDLDDDGLGEKEAIMSFNIIDEDEIKELPFSLYGYEIKKL